MKVYTSCLKNSKGSIGLIWQWMVGDEIGWRWEWGVIFQVRSLQVRHYIPKQNSVNFILFDFLLFFIKKAHVCDPPIKFSICFENNNIYNYVYICVNQSDYFRYTLWFTWASLTVCLLQSCLLKTHRVTMWKDEHIYRYTDVYFELCMWV